MSEVVQSDKLEHEDDDNPENFVPVTSGAGSLLSVKQKVEYVMRLKDRGFIELEEGDNVLALYDFNNVKTNERVLIFLIDESQFMYITKSFDEDFEVLRSGTYEHSDIEGDTSITDVVDKLVE